MTAWMELEGFMLNEISQTEGKNVSNDPACMWNQKNKKNKNKNKN